MNLRILKKLSKRVRPLLEKLVAHHSLTHYTTSEKGDGSVSTLGFDRKHWQRNPARHAEPFGGVVCISARRDGRVLPFVHIREPWSPWHGTPMVGWMDGYYEPEWEERSAWEYLCDLVDDICGEYVEVEADPSDEFGITGLAWRWNRRVRNPSQILQVARERAEAVSP
ncbi:hypothetical protein EA658_10030 [Pseudoxanthomonas winnipegensis]|uniref:Uncharacterized protein n=1 Tax=Pseudoxanthomonas winnipegensis TaxID=2480810 RepID=A0ABY1WCY0_9GAMM|nr:hypothetical protein [Pseudoxanthomonas winnipegensis]TAA12431.1 hypothetical protein EA659_03620 [Pseudoxanthomonas winnipegensis]TAA19203.1 hypothetical protein EA658_10030 [Pseudoxanthomonas winnipegensis]TAH70464.1 hypothetical protein EA657_17095 [Pseudoxanthomonas winnipegensis]